MFKGAEKLFFLFQDFVREIDPDIIIGYNICKFDLPYLIQVVMLLFWCINYKFFIFLFIHTHTHNPFY